MSHTVWDNISLPLFDFHGVFVSFTTSIFSNITCRKARSFCILNGESISISIFDSQIINVNSTKSLIVLKSPSGDTFLENMNVSNINNIPKISSSISVFHIGFGDNIVLSNTRFNYSSCTALSIERCNLTITDSIFTNILRDNNLPQSLKLSSIKTSRALYIDSTDASIVNSSFIGNVAMDGKGGVSLFYHLQ